MTRILLTGSRTWRDVNTMTSALRYHRDAHPDAVLVHGGAVGADEMADTIWTGWGGATELHEVTELDYATSGRQAPLLRNTHMVNLDARFCLAFWAHAITSGTRDCVLKAVAAGIPIYHHWAHSRPPYALAEVYASHGIPYRDNG